MYICIYVNMYIYLTFLIHFSDLSLIYVLVVLISAATILVHVNTGLFSFYEAAEMSMYF